MFEDVKPATKYHFLVVTNEHIRDAKALVSAQVRLLDRMVEVGNQVLAEKLNQDATITVRIINNLFINNTVQFITKTSK